MNYWQAFWAMVGMVALFLLYFLPYLIARHRYHNNDGAICAANFFFGWTGIGWVVCLIWALTDNVDKEE